MLDSIKKMEAISDRVAALSRQGQRILLVALQIAQLLNTLDDQEQKEEALTLAGELRIRDE